MPAGRSGIQPVRLRVSEQERVGHRGGHRVCDQRSSLERIEDGDVPRASADLASVEEARGHQQPCDDELRGFGPARRFFARVAREGDEVSRGLLVQWATMGPSAQRSGKVLGARHVQGPTSCARELRAESRADVGLRHLLRRDEQDVE